MTTSSKTFDFVLDRSGLQLEAPRRVELELDYEELGIDPEQAASQLGALLSRLLGETVADEEGLFDLGVYRDGTLVATLALACEDEALDVVGERDAAVSERELAHALLDELPKARAR